MWTKSVAYTINQQGINPQQSNLSTKGNINERFQHTQEQFTQTAG